MGSQTKLDASEWSQITGCDDLLKNVAAQRFEELLTEAICLKGESITLYRGTGHRGIGTNAAIPKPDGAPSLKD